MSNSIEQDTQKSKKKAKVFKIVAIIAAVAVVGWTIYSVVMNPNQSERLLLNSYVKYYREVEEPASFQLVDCSAYRDAVTTQGKEFTYTIVEVKNGDKDELLLLVVDGENNGTVYSEKTLGELDCADKKAIRFEINDHQEDVNLKKVQQQIKRYWQFHDKT